LIRFFYLPLFTVDCRPPGEKVVLLNRQLANCIYREILTMNGHVRRILRTLRKTTSRYLVEKKLGEGALGEVNLEFDTFLHRHVAVKHLKKKFRSDAYQVQMFLNEAKLVSFLNHRGIITTYDLFVQKGGGPGYAMGLVEGQPLEELLGSLPFSRLVQIFTKICETMAYAHSRGVAHLDLKPENVMAGRYGEVVIVDWGIARIFDDRPYKAYVGATPTEDSSLFFAESAQGCGTPLYMSPEHITLSRDQLGAQADIWSLGVLFFRMCTGRFPFMAKNPADLFQLIQYRSAPSAAAFNPQLPVAYSDIIRKMLHIDPRVRYQKCSEILADLEQVHQSGQAFEKYSFGFGQDIFRQGDRGDYAFTIISGTVQILREFNGQQKVLATLGVGEIVGELALFTAQPRTATARVCSKQATIAIMHRQQVEAELHKLAPWVPRMITTLSDRFNKVNTDAALLHSRQNYSGDPFSISASK